MLHSSDVGHLSLMLLLSESGSTKGPNGLLVSLFVAEVLLSVRLCWIM